MQKGTIEISKIKVKDNIRKDYGDLTELTASIKENGVRQPVELNSNNELVDGHRRLAAAKAAGKKEISYFINEKKLEKEVSQLIAGIFPKNLNPIEEGEAFKKYMKDHKASEETLAKKIGKTKDYINRRINLLSATDQVKKALVEKKIELGHAVVLSRIDQKKQGKLLKDIIGDKIPVRDIENVFSCYDGEIADLNEASFSKKECKDCKHNGGEQQLLIDVGDNLKGTCLNPPCFVRKTNEWIKAEKEALEKKGIKVIDYDKIGEIPGSKRIREYDDEYKTAIKNLEKKPDTYAVAFNKDDGGSVEKQIWRIKSKKESKDIDEEAAGKLNLSRREKLKAKVECYKRDFLIKKSQELLKPGLTLKALILWDLLERYDPGFLNKKEVEKIFSETGAKLDKRINEAAKDIFCMMRDFDYLKIAAKSIGVNLKEHFAMTEEFLKLYTKREMIKLAKKLKIDIGKATKNPEIIAAIVKGWKKGQVPKLML